MRIYIQPHPTLKRDGDDLYAVTAISFPDAALGTKVTVPCLEAERVIVTVPPGSQNGTCYVPAAKACRACMVEARAISMSWLK